MGYGLWVINLGYTDCGLFSPWVVFPQAFFDSDSMSGLFECCRDIECASIFGEFRNIGNGFNFLNVFELKTVSSKLGSFLVVSIASSIFFFSGWWIVIDAAVRCNISDVPAAQMQEID